MLMKPACFSGGIDAGQAPASPATDRAQACRPAQQFDIYVQLLKLNNITRSFLYESLIRH
jgi:hypothetical protein